MTDVFISYSRKDKTFVQALHKAIEAKGRDAWVDWEGIPLTADWWAEIQEGIETADSFVFIISPDSVASKVCAQEIDHATMHKKRIVPVVYRDAPDVPKSLAHLNWVFCRESDDFDNAFNLLMATMDTDLEWVKAHTRLIQRAVEWDKKKRSDSFVLRGEDLAAAERMLAQTEKDPKLTELQAAYILASRQNATRRQRLTTAAVTFGLIVAIILGLVAFYAQTRAVAGEQLAKEAQATSVSAETTAVAERDLAAAAEATSVSAEATAVAERDLAAAAQARAEEQARQARENQARLLAAQANNILDQKLRSRDLALLLARQAVQTTWSVDGAVVQEAEAVLGRALTELWRVTLAHPHLGNPSVGTSILALSPNGTAVMIQPYPVNDNWISLPEVWDTMTGKQLKVAGEDNLVSFSQDGTKLVTSFYTDPTSLRLWDMATETLIGEIHGQFKSLNQAGTRLVSDDGSGSLSQVWDTTTATLISEIPGEFKAFSQDGTRLVSDDGSGALSQVWDATTGTLISEIPGEFKAFSQDGTRLVSDDGSGALSQVWDATTGTPISEIPGTFMAFSQDGLKTLTSSSDGVPAVWDTTTAEAQTLQDISGLCSAFSGDGTKLECMPSAMVPPCSNSFLVDLTGGETINLCNFVAMTFDGTKIIDENQGAYRLVVGATGASIDLPGKFVFLSPNGATIVVDKGLNILLMLDTTPALQTPPTNPEELLEAATNHILRTPPEFTPEEREEFGLE
jgi:WD40 repeat protein